MITRTQAQIIAVVFIVAFYVLTQSALAMSFAVVAALVFMIPDHWFRRMTGYVVVVDFLASGYIFTSFMGVAAVSAAEIGVFAALGISVTLRVMRSIIGAERVSINDTTETREVIALLFSQGVAWCKAFGRSITTGTVIPPEPLDISWVEVQAGAGFKGTLKSVFSS
jgi:hypothetical protein